MSEFAKNLRGQLVLLGTGEEKYHLLFRDLAKKYSKKFGCNILFDPKMSKRVYAGADVFLMPSYYEPCGLGQLIAMRYGAVPLVRETGGLADTVKNYNPRTGEGNGFVFKEYSPEALYKAMEKVVAAFKDKKVWFEVMKNGMKSDFSWKTSAKKYMELYK